MSADNTTEKPSLPPGYLSVDDALSGGVGLRRRAGALLKVSSDLNSAQCALIRMGVHKERLTTSLVAMLQSGVASLEIIQLDMQHLQEGINVRAAKGPVLYHPREVVEQYMRLNPKDKPEVGEARKEAIAEMRQQASDLISRLEALKVEKRLGEEWIGIHILIEKLYRPYNIVATKAIAEAYPRGCF